MGTACPLRPSFAGNFPLCQIAIGRFQSIMIADIKKRSGYALVGMNVFLAGLLTLFEFSLLSSAQSSIRLESFEDDEDRIRSEKNWTTVKVRPFGFTAMSGMVLHFHSTCFRTLGFEAEPSVLVTSGCHLPKPLHIRHSGATCGCA
jgi:hypothetical protein